MVKQKVKEFPVMQSICFWCGDTKNEILIGTKAKSIKSIGHKVVKDYDFCDSCQEIMKQGITCIEVDTLPWSEGQPSMGGGYPSGRWCVITEDGVKDVIEESETLRAIIEKRKVFLPKEVYLQMFNQIRRDIW